MYGRLRIINQRIVYDTDVPTWIIARCLDYSDLSDPWPIPTGILLHLPRIYQGRPRYSNTSTVCFITGGLSSCPKMKMKLERKERKKMSRPVEGLFL